MTQPKNRVFRAHVLARQLEPPDWLQGATVQLFTLQTHAITLDEVSGHHCSVSTPLHNILQGQCKQLSLHSSN
jgi:hypothetical protein